MKLVTGAALSVAISTSAYAADMAYKAPDIGLRGPIQPTVFIDVGAGAGFSVGSNLKFVNPVGTEFTDNAISGDQIILSGVDANDASFAANISIGYFVTPNLYIKGSYRYFGEYTATGNASFGGDPYEQSANARAQGILAGVGYIHNLNEAYYLDIFAEAGAAYIKTKGTQGANLFPDDPGYFPGHSQTNFVAGLGLGLGYRLSDSIDLTLTGTYHYLGDVETGTTGADNPVMNEGERLEITDFGVASIVAGIRAKF